MSPPPSPSRLTLPARYEDICVLGEGGMGRVFRAHDREEDRWVAIKALRSAGSEDLPHLQREVRLLGHLHHESIVRLFDVGFCGGEIYLAMELVHGVMLRDFLDRPPPDAGEIRWLLRVALKTLEALEYLHGEEWVHGDIKPSNIMVAVPDDLPPTPETARSLDDAPVKLLDFGLAREKGPVAHAGTTAGTPIYMAPERIEGQASFDPRSDLYSLGAVLYHLVARAPPFSSLAATRSRRSPLVSPRSRNPACPEEIAALILKLLEREPHQRPSSAREAREAVLAQLQPGTRAQVALPRILPPSFVGRTGELEALRKHLESAARGKGSMVLIAGERAMGKTWLLEQSGLKGDALVDLGMAQVRGTFSAGGAPHQGLRGVLQGLIDLVSARSGPDAVREIAGPWAADLAETLGIRLPAPAMEHPEPPADQDSVAAQSRLLRERLYLGAMQILRSAAELGPLFLVVEDVHHADELDLELLARLGRAARELPLVLAVTFRLEAARGLSILERWGEGAEGREDVAHITLGGLADHEIVELARRMLRPEGPASRDLVALVSRTSEGKPLEAIRCLQSLWQRGALVRDGDVWGLRSGTEAMDRAAVPGWSERLADLEPSERHIVAAAVVLGLPSEEDLLGRLLAEERGSTPAPQEDAGAEIRTRLRSLVRRGLLLDGPDGLAAPSDLDEEALAPIVGEEYLRALHARAAGILLDWYGIAADSHAYRIADHHRRAGNASMASELYLRAARHATRAFANRRGIEAFHLALDLCTDPPLKRRIAEELGELHARVGEYPVALECFRLAQQLEGSEEGASGTGTRPRSVEHGGIALLDKIGRVLHRQGEFAEALAMFSRCLEASEGKPAERALALFRIGGVYLERGDVPKSKEFLEKSLAAYRQLGDYRQIAAVESGLGLAEKAQNRLDSAIVHLEEALRNSERSGVLLDIATTLNNLGNIHRARGDDQGAVDCLRRSIEVRERVGDRPGLAICLNNIARVHAFRGELRQAREATETALRIFEEIGDKKGVLIARSNLGEMVHLLGDLTRARELYRGNLELARNALVQRLFETNLCNLAELEIDAGNPAEAAEVARTCLQTLPDEPPVELRAQALGVLAAASLALQGLEQAGDALREAFDIARELNLREKMGVLAGRQIRFLIQKGEPEAAAAFGKRFLSELEQGSDRHGLARFHRDLGCAYRELGPDWADLTEKHLNLALRAFDGMGSIFHAALTRQELAAYWRLQGEEEMAEELAEQARKDLERSGALGRARQLDLSEKDT